MAEQTVCKWGAKKKKKKRKRMDELPSGYELQATPN